ncbi:MAG: response regulator, partial [Clostridia bacterium]|nr:response regulator [Clostridia bacterium]
MPKKILVVEDNQLNMEYLVEALNAVCCCEIIQAFDGKGALIKAL